MDPQQTVRLIEAAGGDSAFAELLGLDKKEGYQQRVNNWKRRGIPPQVILDHLEVIKKLQRSLQ